MRREILAMIERGIKVGDVIYDSHRDVELYLLTTRKGCYSTVFYLIDFNAHSRIVPFSFEILNYWQTLLNSTPIKQYKLPNFVNDIKVSHQCDGRLFLSFYELIIKINDNLYCLYTHYGTFRKTFNKKDLESYAESNLTVEIVGGLRETIARNLLQKLGADKTIFRIETKVIKTLRNMLFLD